MVVVTGGGNHGQSLASPPNTCVNGYLNRYLATGALPAGPGPVNATCPALPAAAREPDGPPGRRRGRVGVPLPWEGAAHQDVEVVVAAPAERQRP